MQEQRILCLHIEIKSKQQENSRLYFWECPDCVEILYLNLAIVVSFALMLMINVHTFRQIQAVKK